MPNEVACDSSVPGLEQRVRCCGLGASHLLSGADSSQVTATEGPGPPAELRIARMRPSPSRYRAVACCHALPPVSEVTTISMTRCHHCRRADRWHWLRLRSPHGSPLVQSQSVAKTTSTSSVGVRRRPCWTAVGQCHGVRPRHESTSLDLRPTSAWRRHSSRRRRRPSRIRSRPNSKAEA